ncbi:MAG: ImmA/IrrE family metallo-endopeptidase [Dehalococcoidia bacterium]
MAARYALARKRATQLLVKAGVTEPPVPVEALASLVGATIRYEPFDGSLSGMAYRRPDAVNVIGVNSLQPLTRKRFTIAHEIGHLLLHSDDDMHVDEYVPIGFRNDVSSMAINEREVEANQFAAELLMPADTISREFQSIPEDVQIEDIIDRLSQRYGVSSEAMTIRLSRLKLIR